MEANENFEKIDIPVEEDEATRIRDKRKQMCDQILKIEKDNIILITAVTTTVITVFLVILFFITSLTFII